MAGHKSWDEIKHKRKDEKSLEADVQVEVSEAPAKEVSVKILTPKKEEVSVSRGTGGEFRKRNGKLYRA